MTTQVDVPFFLTDEQIEFSRVLERMLAERWPLDRRRDANWENEGLWNDLVELGVLGLLFTEEHGGLSGRSLDHMLVSAALGKNLVKLPPIDQVFLASTLLGIDAKEIVSDIISGSRRYAVASDLNAGSSRLATCHRVGDDFRLDANMLTLHGDSDFETVLVPARHSEDLTKVSLFKVARSTSSMSVIDGPGLDGRANHSLNLADTIVTSEGLVGLEGTLADRLERTAEMLCLRQAAYAIGISEALLERTVNYVKVRKQFGSTISSFQAIQHRLVQMFASIKIGLAQVQSAFAQFGCTPPQERKAIAISTKMYVDDLALGVAREAVQMHGGMGLTSELDVGEYFKSLLILRQSDGGPRSHLKSLLNGYRFG